MLFPSLKVVTLAFSLLATRVTAVPYGSPQPTSTFLSRLAIPSSTLPPPTGLELKFLGLGVGTQNYTCASNGSAVPVSNGALATLYDLGTQLNKDPLAQWKINSISGLALSLSMFPRMLDFYLDSQGYQQVLGEHFFTPALIPTFSLFNIKPQPFPQVNGKKNGTMAAPSTACPGTRNEGAVPWLYLVDNGGSQGGVNTVYRLETAGGQPPATCQDQDAYFEVPYAAQYWVYGPK